MLFDYKKANKILKQELTPFRYQHSLGTMDMCEQLAVRYGYSDIEGARIAGLLHDCAKDISDEKMLEYCAFYSIPLDDYYRTSPVLAHGLVGYEMARELFLGTTKRENEILNAIKCHATGAPEMTILSQILFIADYTETGRLGEKFDRIRNAAANSIQQGLLEAFNHLIRSSLKANDIIHPLTIAGRNELLRTYSDLFLAKV